MFTKIFAVAVCLFGLTSASGLYNGIANYGGYGAGYGGYGLGGHATSYSSVTRIPAAHGGYSGALVGTLGAGYGGLANGALGLNGLALGNLGYNSLGLGNLGYNNLGYGGLGYAGLGYNGLGHAVSTASYNRGLGAYGGYGYGAYGLGNKLVY